MDTKQIKSDEVRVEAPAECLKCDKHGKCATEFVGGEENALNKKEMDMVIALFEMCVGALNRDWEAPERKNQREIMNDEIKAKVDTGIPIKKCHASETSVGKDYFKFALTDFTNMRVVTEMVTDIVNEADARNKKAFAEAMAKKN